MEASVEHAGQSRESVQNPDVTCTPDKALGGLHSENMVGDTGRERLSAYAASRRRPAVFIAGAALESGSPQVPGRSAVGEAVDGVGYERQPQMTQLQRHADASDRTAGA